MLGNFINNMFQTIMLTIDSVIYHFAAMCYQLFIYLASARIFDDEFFSNFANRIYVILGVFMLFYLAYALLISLIDPDKLQKETAGIAKNLVISLVLLGFLPSIFSYAYRLQNYILSSNLLGALILGQDIVEIDDTGYVDSNQFNNGSNDESDPNGMITFGDTLAFTVMNVFINPDNYNVAFDGRNDFNWLDYKKNVLLYGNYDGLGGLASSITSSEIMVYKSGDNGNTSETIKDSVKYSVLISTAVGIGLIYILLTFTLDLGVRVFKLAFLQLIAPIPIIMRIIPSKKGTFDKWLKMSLATYLEVFIRVGIMYIAVYFINAFFNGNRFLELWKSGMIGKFAVVVLIFSILTFAKQVPKIISEALGFNTDSLKFTSKDKGVLGKGLSALAGFGLGATTGALGAGWTAMVNKGNIGQALSYGFLKGGKAGGLQFNSQRNGLYTKYGLKGPAGWFGGRSWAATSADKFENDLQNEFAKPDSGTNSKWLRNAEQGMGFQNTLTASVEKVNNLRDAESKYREGSGGIKALTQRINSTKANGELLKNRKTDVENRIRQQLIAESESYRDSAAAQGNAAEVLRWNSEIEQLRNGVNTTSYNDRISSLRTSNTGDGAILNQLDRNITQNEQSYQRLSANLNTVVNNMNSDEDVIAARNKVKNMIKDVEVKDGDYDQYEALTNLSEADLRENIAMKDARRDYSRLNSEYNDRLTLETKERNEAADKEWLRGEEGRHFVAGIEAANKRGNKGSSSGGNDKKSK